MTILIPMAGAGSRFKESIYKKSKPIIKINGKQMVIKAVDMLPKNENEKIIFICRDFHLEEKIDEEIKKHYKNASFISINSLTEGQACTCLMAKKEIDNKEELIIAACDNGIIYNEDLFEKAKKEYDAIVFTFKNDKSVEKNPNQYGWAKVNEKNEIMQMSVKKAISETPIKDNALVGTFWFKEGKNFVLAAKKMIENNERINNEFYVDKCIDTLIQMKKKVYALEVEKFYCWGTPYELEMYCKNNKIKNEVM